MNTNIRRYVRCYVLTAMHTPFPISRTKVRHRSQAHHDISNHSSRPWARIITSLYFNSQRESGLPLRACSFRRRARVELSQVFPWNWCFSSSQTLWQVFVGGHHPLPRRTDIYSAVFTDPVFCNLELQSQLVFPPLLYCFDYRAYEYDRAVPSWSYDRPYASFVSQ